MKFELNEKQFAALMNAIGASSYVYGLLSDMVDDKFKTNLNEIESLEKYFLKFAEIASFPAENIEDFQGEKVLSQSYLDKIGIDMANYDQFAFWDVLVKSLAQRELERNYTQEQIEGLTELEFIEKSMNLEDKYRQEFAQNGLDNVNINIQ
ncbi:MAG: hypothetical protein V3575_03260 [Candidatus Absconditabacteria bacterium]